MTVINKILFDCVDRNEDHYKIAVNILSLLEGMSIKEIGDLFKNLNYFFERIPMSFKTQQ